MRHYYQRVRYYAAEDLPIEEVHLDGVYEAVLTPDDIKKRRDRAAEKAAAAVKRQQDKVPAWRRDAYGGRTFFSR
jgi:hypothetical protein